MPLDFLTPERNSFLLNISNVFGRNQKLFEVDRVVDLKLIFTE